MSRVLGLHELAATERLLIALTRLLRAGAGEADPCMRGPARLKRPHPSEPLDAAGAFGAARSECPGRRRGEMTRMQSIVLSCPALPCLVLACPICPVLSCLALSGPGLSYLILACPVLLWGAARQDWPRVSWPTAWWD